MSSFDFTTLERVDVHTHAIAPKYHEFLIQTGHQNPDGWPEIPVSHRRYSPARRLQLTIRRNGHQSNIS